MLPPAVCTKFHHGSQWRFSYLFFLLLFAFCLNAFAGSRLHVPRAVGKDFYIVFPKAAWGNQNVGVLINSPTAQTATISPPKGKPTAVVFDKPRTTKYVGNLFNIESVPEVVRSREATRIRTDDAVSIVGQFGIGGISGTYTAMPITSWGKEYYVVAPPEGQNSTYSYYPTVYSVPMVTIIGSHIGTSVTITPTALTALGHQPTVPYTITLNDGDVFNITTAGDPKAVNRTEDQCHADLSGTHITSDYPVGVIVAQTHSSWPCGVNECGDYCVEWLPPAANWDSLYVITPSVQRLNDMAGEALRLVFMHDSTTLTVENGVDSAKVIGMYNRGEWVDYPNPISSAIILSGSHPFLPAEFTVKPQSQNCQVGGGGEAWTLGMMIPNGVHQWSSYAPYCSPTGSQAIANVCFVLGDTAKLTFNGKPFLQQFPIVKHLPQGLAMIPMGINSATYYEITGDSGAGAAGSIFGYGTLRYSPGGNHGNRVQDPEIIKSFAHPIGGSFTPLRSKDTLAPRCTIKSTCGGWTVSATEDVNDVNETGIYEVWLEHLMPSDSSGNVAFRAQPSFAYGAMSVSNTIDIVNPFQSAQAALHVRDGAGNQFDTGLYATPTLVDVSPTAEDVGAVRPGDNITTQFVIRNHADTAVTFNSFRLKSGSHWKIVAPVPAMPATLLPDDSVKIFCAYRNPGGALFESDRDSLMATTCREFMIATMTARTKLPSIATAHCFDFGSAIIDNGNDGGDTLQSLRGVWITNVGSDTLSVSGLTISGAVDPPNTNFPGSDFWFGTGSTYKTQTLHALPSSAAPWLISAGDTIFVDVIGHAHQSGARQATITFESNGGQVVPDTTCLMIYGLWEGILAMNIDYGTHLYGTTADSFFVVRNIGTVDFHIDAHGFDAGLSPDSASFVFHQYRDTVSGYSISYDLTDTCGLRPGDTVNVPYRFIANALGPLSDSIAIHNSSLEQAIVQLRGRVVQPHIWGTSACISDTIHVGETIYATMNVGNDGTSSLHIENIDLAGDRVGEWTIKRVSDPQVSFDVTSPPWSFTLAPAGQANVYLEWIPLIDSAPVVIVRITGTDDRGRQATDSLSNTFYPWLRFPYDTVMPIAIMPCLTGVDQHAAASPSQNILWPNYPNPFSTTTALSYTIGVAGHVTVRLVNLLGETVAMLVNAHQVAGTYSVTAKGAGLKAGMYFVELNAGGVRVARKIIVVQ